MSLFNNKWVDGCFCGSVTGCVVVVLLAVIGVPLLTVGIILTSIFGWDGNTAASVAGKSMFTAALLLAAGGLVAVFYMCRMGPKILKITHGPKRKKQQPQNKQLYEQFSNDPQSGNDTAPPAYEESAHHRQFYPSNPGQAHACYNLPQSSYSAAMPPQDAYQYSYTQCNNYTQQLPHQGSYPQQMSNSQYGLSQQYQNHPHRGTLKAYAEQQKSASGAISRDLQANLMPVPPSAPAFAEVQLNEPSAPLVSPPPPAYGPVAPPCENAGPLPMKI